MRSSTGSQGSDRSVHCSDTLPLPHPHPVTQILEDYAANELPKRPAGSAQVDILEETLAGIKEYFDKGLGRILLYKQVPSLFE